MASLAAQTQDTTSPHPGTAAIHGTIRGAAGKVVEGASVVLHEQGHSDSVTTHTNTSGAFTFPALHAGNYTLQAQKYGAGSSVTDTVELAAGGVKELTLVLKAGSQPAGTSSSSQSMGFTDEATFTVAGITDWTAAGGHGSDTGLRTSEDLARETVALKPGGSEHSGPPASATESQHTESMLRASLGKAPGSFDANHLLGEFYLRTGRYREAIPLLQTSYQIDPANHDNEYDLALACKAVGDVSRARDHVQNVLTHEDKAELHRLLADLDEQSGDSVAAVHEDEEAVRLDPSEENYFEWGSELLLHRAVRPAVEVFRKGTEAHPKSERMLAALGAALFASDFYHEAALRLCAASDLNPADASPYIFLAKMEMAAPMPLSCVDRKLARFAQRQPENAQANYYYATALWKRQKSPENQRDLPQVETLLTKAVTIDPKFAEAYLQLGVFHFAKSNFNKAIGFYKRAIEANPQLSEAHYRLGVAYERIGEPSKARQELQLHDDIEKLQAAAIERQRREVRQFMVVLKGDAASPSPH